MEGVFVILQFAMFGKSCVALRAFFRGTSFDFCFSQRCFLSFKSPQRVFSHRFLDDVFRGRGEPVKTPQMRLNVPLPEADDVTLVAPEVEPPKMNGVFVIFQFAVFREDFRANAAGFGRAGLLSLGQGLAHSGFQPLIGLTDSDAFLSKSVLFLILFQLSRRWPLMLLL